MALIVGCLRLTLAIAGGQSLKDKRAVVRRVVDRTRRQFAVSVAEIETQDDRRVATLGVVCVSNSRTQCQAVLQQVLRFVERLPLDAEIRDVATETIVVLE